MQLFKYLTCIAVGPSGLWVGAADSTVSHLDPESGAMIGLPVAVSQAPVRLVADAEGVWVEEQGGSLERIEAR